MSTLNFTRSSWMAASFLVGLTLSAAISTRADDRVAQRQRKLSSALQHILVPYLDTEQGPARRYMSPRPWRSALARHTASLQNATNVREAAAWFQDEKNLIVGEWEILMLLRSYHVLKNNEHFVASGARRAVERYLRHCRRQTNTKGARVNWKLDGYWGSENHKIVQFSNRLLLE